MPIELRSDEVPFYEIAATLIPLLLFGGVAIDRLRPERGEDVSDRRLGLALLIPSFGGLAIVAEVFALQNVILRESPGLVGRAVVAAALVSGMALVILATFLPWLGRLRERMPTRLYRRSVRLGLGGLALAWVIPTVLLTYALDTAGFAREVRLDAHEVLQLEADLRRVNRQTEAASRRLASGTQRVARLSVRVEAARAAGNLAAARGLSGAIDSIERQMRFEQATIERLLRESVRLHKGFSLRAQE